MKCSDCPYYKSGYLYNACAVAEIEYFHIMNDCDLVNDDGTVNYDNIFNGITTESEERNDDD